jgi:hypothetical protein
MIEIPLGTALILYSSILLTLAFASWLYTEISTHHAYRKLEQQYLWRCVYCAYTYLDEKASRMSKCPRCASYNTAGDKGAKFVTPKKEKEAPQNTDEQQESRRNPSKGRRRTTRSRGPRRSR